MLFDTNWTHLSFCTKTNGSASTNLVAPFSWTSNGWHQIALTYTPTNSYLYLDGQLATNGTGASHYPNLTERAKGFRIGSDQNGNAQAKGTFEELETFNYPLNASDISSNYLAVSQRDRDGNGMSDLWELQNFGYVGVDPNGDSDGDGISNLQEYQNGTDPHQFTPTRLGYWRFNDVPAWRDESGLSPVRAYQLVPLPSWSADSVRIGPKSLLSYPGVRPNGSLPAAVTKGSIRFWFKPDWSASDKVGDEVRLFEIGQQSTNASYGWFALSVNSIGTKLFLTTEGDGVPTEYLRSSVQFDFHLWRQIVLTYDSTETKLFIDGNLVATDSGLLHIPPLAVVKQGFQIGCSWDGIHQANGCFDEFETFNYVLAPTNILADFQSKMNLDTDGDGLADILEDGLGTRIDAKDSDCDGLPDGWEVSHGLNPLDPGDGIQENLSKYMGIQDQLPIGCLSTQSVKSVMQAGKFSFGSFPAGYYTVCYSTGAWICSTPSWWAVNQTSPGCAPTNSITMTYNAGWGDGTGHAEFTGSLRCDYTNQDDAQAGAVGSHSSFSHYGGDISIAFVDYPYADNQNSFPYSPPTYYLYQPGFEVQSSDIVWLNATQCCATFTIHNSTIADRSNLAVRLLNIEGIPTASGVVTNWSINSQSTSKVSFIFNATSIIEASTATLEFSENGKICFELSRNLGFTVRPGQEAAYLIWAPYGTGTATYNIWRSSGTSNNWGSSSIATTTNLYYQNTNLTAGVTYYYKVQSVSGSSNAWTTVIGVSPFTCPALLLPRIDYVDELNLPANNNVYPLNFNTLQTNSDALDPQGYPLVFKVESVGIGSLMINGEPFSVDNCTIDTNATVIWTPPAKFYTNLPAFHVYVFDEINRSVKTVDVLIKQRPRTHLYGWGHKTGMIGDGTIYPTIYNTNEILNQARDGILPIDPRWHVDTNHNLGNVGQAPTRVLDLDDVVAVSPYCYYHPSAVTGDGRLWMWGEEWAAAFGRPLVITNLVGGQWQPSDVQEFHAFMRNLSDTWAYTLLAPSPILVQDPATHQPLDGVLAAEGDYLLKSDGSIWSSGAYDVFVSGVLGRIIPDESDDRWGYGEVNEAMRLGRIEFEGNNNAGPIKPGRQVVELHAAPGSGIARCQDGSVWWWGSMNDWIYSLGSGAAPLLHFSLVSNDGYEQVPQRLTCLDYSDVPPIKQIAADCQEYGHFTFLHEDGTVSEIGYIARLDPRFSEGPYADPTPAYVMQPVAVEGLPENIIQISGGHRFTAALTDDGKVWVWGYWEGNNGGGPSQNLIPPTEIASLEDIVKVVAGDQYILALDKYGIVWGVGRNRNGIFGFTDSDNGNGTTIYSEAIKVPGIENVKNIFLEPSAPNAFAIGTAPEDKPVGLNAFSLDQKIRLEWTTFTNASHYIVYRSLNRMDGYMPIGDTAVNSYVDESPLLQNGQTYYYQVSAIVNGVESAHSWEVKAVPIPLPSIAQSVMATGVCRGVQLTWSSPTNALLSFPQEYQVERANDFGGPFVLIARFPTNTTSFVDDSTAVGHTYYYQVIPANTAGVPTGSAIVSGAIDTNSCADAPSIADDWRGRGWFVSPRDPNGDMVLTGPNGDMVNVTLYWTGPKEGDWYYVKSDFIHPDDLDNQIDSIIDPQTAFYTFLSSKFTSGAKDILTSDTASTEAKFTTFIEQLNLIIQGTNLYNPAYYTGNLSLRTVAQLQKSNLTGDELVKLNRMLLDDAFGYYTVFRGPSWGNGLTGFRVYYSYELNGLSSSFVYDIPLAQAVGNETLMGGIDGYTSDGTLNTPAYSASWSMPVHVRAWAKVSAVVDGVEGDSSFEVGPLATTDDYGWSVILRAVPGYQQVYLDWPDLPSACTYSVECTPYTPGLTPDSSTDEQDAHYYWMTIATDLTEPRYWNTIVDTQFAPSDINSNIKYVVDDIRYQQSPAGTILWSKISQSQCASNALMDFADPETKQSVTNTRSILASEFTRLIHGGSILFTTNDLGATAGDLTTQTLAMLSRTDLSSNEVTILNRRLLEEVYVGHVARVARAEPAEFTSRDFEMPDDSGIKKIYNIFHDGVANGFMYQNGFTSNICTIVWGKFSDSLRFGLTNNVTDWAVSAPPLKRQLAIEMTHIIQTNAGPLLAAVDPGWIWKGNYRTRQWLDRASSLSTNEMSVLNRVIIEDGLNVNGGGIYPYSDIRYYRVWAHFCDNGDTVSDWADAAPLTTITNPPTLVFSAQAFPYDSMVSVQWNIPGTNTYVPGAGTDWQFSLERKETNASYEIITDTDFGLGFLDDTTLNDHTYKYQVMALDPYYNRYFAETAWVTPTNGGGLRLMQLTPGNSYVDLVWTPVRATRFEVRHSVGSTNGPWETVAILDPPDVYQNAPNTYRHVGLQNGIDHYYQIEATTPTGFLIDSDIRSARPLATLAPLPPYDFHGDVLPDSGDGPGHVLLAWIPQKGVSEYEVFLCDQTRNTLLFDGHGTSFSYPIPDDIQIGQSLTFGIRSVSAAGIAGDMVQTNVTYVKPQPPVVLSDPPLVLKVAGTVPDGSNAIQVTAPTNLVLSVDLNIPDAQSVSFFVDDELIGTVNSAPFQMIWYHVTGGSHILHATALSQSSIIDSATQKSFDSADVYLSVVVQPELAAYQTSATDLQLPSVGFPISLSRSYGSRNTNVSDVLGIGWASSWSAGSVTLSHPLSDGWNGIFQTGFASEQFGYINDTAGHYVIVSLPNGQSVGFSMDLDFDHGVADHTYPAIEEDPSAISVSFQPFDQNSGTFSSGLNSLTLNNPTDPDDTWDGADVEFDSATLSQISYAAPDGTVYSFGKPASTDSTNLNWLLTSITDRNGNIQTYSYNGTSQVISVTNSCGRGIWFEYITNTTTSTLQINVYDSVARYSSSPNPSVKYIVTANQLVEVDKLIDRSGVYEAARYDYGTGDSETNRLTDIYDARGVRVLHNTYTNDGDLFTQTDAANRTINYNYNPTNEVLTVTRTVGDTTTTMQVEHDASGAISGVTQPATNGAPPLAVQNTYDDRGRLIAQTDANGNTKTYTYDSQDRLIGQSDELGNSTGTTLNGFNEPTATTDAMGKQTFTSYDGQGNPLQVRDPSDAVTAYSYHDAVTESGHQILPKMIASESKNAPFVPFTIVTEYGYKTSGATKGDLTSTTEQGVYGDHVLVGTIITTTNEYDDNGNKTREIRTRTVPNGTQTIINDYIYDAQNRMVTNIIRATGDETFLAQTNITVYKFGKQVMSIDAAGRTNTSVYDFAGNLIETEYPDGTVTRTTYDDYGRQEWVQQRAIAGEYTTNLAIHNHYDAAGRVIQVDRCEGVTLHKMGAVANTDYIALAGADAQNKMTNSNPGTVLSSTHTFYDAVGRVQFSVDARGAVTENRYDKAGRRINVLVYTGYTGSAVPDTSSLTPVSSTGYTYDANGNQITVTDAAGHTTTSVYDKANRLVETRYPADNGTISRFTYYDGLGQKIQENDEAGVATAYTYDFRGLLTSVTLAAGTTQAVTTIYGYDELGNQIKQLDAAGHKTTFTYDALGRRTGRILPGNQSEGFAYDPTTGNLRYHTNFNGVIITNLYDTADRLTNVTSLNGYQVSYAYDALGLRTNMTDAGGRTGYSYDSQSRLTNKFVAWSGGPTAALHYGYDTLGTLTSIQSSTSGGVNLLYGYDALGRLTNVIANGSTVASYGFDVVGNLQAMCYGNGATNLYQYDSRNRLTNLVWKASSTALANFNYQLGPTGNRIGSSETVNGTPNSYAWTYDLLYRLTGETIANNGTVTYAYDPVGNRTNRQSSISQLSSTSSSYNANDWLESDGYDSNGNTTTSSTASYQYDVMNHLTNVNNGSIIIAYDGDGNRVSKKMGGVTTYYLVDDRNPSGYVQVLEEYQGSTLNATYNYGLDLISQKTGSMTYYFGYDGHGSTRLLLNTTANITETYGYDAYGTRVIGPMTPSTHYLCCGEQFDSDLNLYYQRARYLKTDTGRFWTTDSYDGNSSDPLSLHKYLYGADNPVNIYDPSGHEGESGVGGMVGSMDFGMMLAQITSPVTTRAVGVAQRVLGVGRPSSKAFWPVYPDYNAFNADMVWDLVGGSIGAEYGKNPDSNQMSCATRVSYALNNVGGNDIPDLGHTTPPRSYKNSSSVTYHKRMGDGKFYIVGAGDMKEYLLQKWGKEDAKIWDVSKLKQFTAGLGAGQIAVFATPGPHGRGHSGVLKQGYEDPYVEGELPVWVWALSTP